LPIIHTFEIAESCMDFTSTIFFLLPFLLAYTVIVVYAERKLSAFMQDRLGPMEVGYYGILQTVADLLKLLQKEKIVPTAASPWLFTLAPLIIFMAVFLGLAVIPLSASWMGAGLYSGLFFLLAITSLDVVGILIAGWSSGNKYSTLGAIRSVAQIISYEVPLGLCVLAVALFSGSLNLQDISIAQSGQNSTYFLGIKYFDVTGLGGFLAWNVFQMPVLMLVWIAYFICSLAESNRAPFDLPEAESELVAGYQTEYSGFPWAIMMLAEYGMMLLTSLLGTILFFGSWNSLLPGIAGEYTTGPVWGIFWLVLKTLTFVALQIWVRWTFPRLRINQLLSLSWKFLTPFMLVSLFIIACWKLLLV
jgi:NADH-quinone oxidoreductase subunit H